MSHQNKSVLQVGNDPRNSVIEHQLKIVIHPFYGSLKGLSNFLRVRALQFGDLHAHNSTVMKAYPYWATESMRLDWKKLGATPERPVTKRMTG